MNGRLAPLRADGWMLLASAIWGAAFVAQRRRRARDRSPIGTVVVGGLVCGAVMYAAFMLQQRGIEAGSTASAAGFITGLYVLFVPVIGILLGVRTHPMIWVGALLATAGLYLLSMGSDLRISWGDTLVLLCAMAWAVHVLLIGRFSPRCDAIELAAAQFLVTGVVALLSLRELPTVGAMQAGLWPLAYLGPVAVGVAFTLQVVGQRTAPPAHAAVILSLEGLFAAVFGAFLGGERLTEAQYGGCALMLAGILVAQWPELRGRPAPR
jgi:drug/metabolite transporter (DMT)-like permease